MAFAFAGHYHGVFESVETGKRLLLTEREVTVYVHGTETPATLYTSRGKDAAAPNPFETDTAGNGEFYADPGLYDLLCNGTKETVSVPIDPVEAAQDADLAGYVALAGVQTVTGTKTFDDIATANIDTARFKGSPWFDITHPDFGATTGSASAALQAAIDAAHAAGGGIVYIPPNIDGWMLTTPISLVGMTSGISIVGAGVERSALRFSFPTGNVFDLTNARFVTFADLTISPAVAKTADALFHLANTGDHRFERLRIGACRQAFRVTDSDDNLWRDIRLVDYTNVEWTHAFEVDGGSASIWLQDVYLGTSQTTTPGAWFFKGSDIDTLVMTRCGVQKFGDATKKIGGVWLTRGQWFHFTDCFIEGGKANDAGIRVDGAAYGVFLNGTHLTTNKHGLHIVSDGTAAPRNVRMSGGRASFNGQHGVFMEGAGAQLADVDISNNSVDLTDTYDGVHVAAGVSDWSVDGGRIGTFDLPVSGGGTRHRHGVFVAVGASDRYSVVGPLIADSAVSPVSDGGTGMNKQILVGGTLTLGDINLYRSATNRAKTDDALEVAGALYIGTDIRPAVGPNAGVSITNLGTGSSRVVSSGNGVPWYIRGSAGHTAALQEWRTYDGTSESTHSRVTPSGFETRGPRPWADVRAYGATGNGTADDAVAIQAAIDAVFAAGGGVVYFPVGTYLLGSTIGLDKTADTSAEVELVGAGGNSVLRATTAITMVRLRTTVGNIRRCALRDIKLNVDHVGATGLEFDRAAFNNVENVEFSGVGIGWKLGLTNTSGDLCNQFDSVRFVQMGRALTVNSSYNIGTNIEFAEGFTGADALNITSGTGNIIDPLVARGNGGTGGTAAIVIGVNAPHTQLGGYVFDSYAIGVEVGACRGTRLRLTVANSATHGVRLNGSLDAICDLILISNSASGAGLGDHVRVDGSAQNCLIRASFVGTNPTLDVNETNAGAANNSYLLAALPNGVTLTSTTSSVWSSAEVRTAGDLIAATAGKGLKVKEGANARMGVATLGTGGTVTVANTSITANTRIFVTVQTVGGSVGVLTTSRSAGTSFTITSSNALETSTVAWFLVEPA